MTFEESPMTLCVEQLPRKSKAGGGGSQRSKATDDERKEQKIKHCQIGGPQLDDGSGLCFIS